VVPDDGSVSRELDKLKAGDHAAARLLWKRYFQRLVRLARRKLTGHSRRAADEEDVALDAFARFCSHAEQGRLPQVRDRNDLWRILVTVTTRMAIDQVRREGRQKRGGHVPAGQAPAGQAAAGQRAAAALVSAPETNPDQIVGREPAPEFIAQVAEECQRLFSALDDAELRSIALWKTEGYTNEEIASELGCVLRTVERKLQTIRQRWSHDDPDGPSGTTARH
jgi:RNA polymerase sigma factor (sigma-70 family)